MLIDDINSLAPVVVWCDEWSDCELARDLPVIIS